MDKIFASVGGLDVHQATIAACRRRLIDSRRSEKEVRTFGTMTSDLLALADWLAEWGVTHVAMESTDVTDCEWIAQLMMHGLIRACFTPPLPIREMRDLVRARSKLVHERQAVINRIHKVLQDANIKLTSVASDIMGSSGRWMMMAMINGETDPEALADLAKASLRNKIPELRRALEGKFTDHHRFLLGDLPHAQERDGPPGYWSRALRQDGYEAFVAVLFKAS